MVIGGAQVQAAAGLIADKATQTLSAALFRVDSDSALKPMKQADKRTVQVHVLADDDAAGKRGIKELERWSSVSTLGPDPAKQHSKGIVADRRHAMVATDIADKDGPQRLEVGVTFGGTAAVKLDAALTATPGSASASAAIHDAAKHGILINDHEAGVLALTTAMRDQISGASDQGQNAASPLVIATKAWDDPTSTTLLAANTVASSRQVITHSMPASQQEELENAGVKVHVVPTGKKSKTAELHGSIIASGATALVASAYFESRVLDGSDGRVSREMGVLSGGQAAQQAVMLLRSVIDDA
jgi:hypothetical protein